MSVVRGIAEGCPMLEARMERSFVVMRKQMGGLCSGGNFTNNFYDLRIGTCDISRERIN